MLEEMGLIAGIGEWALKTACAQNAQWQAMGLRPVTITVNLSARQLRDEEFPDRVQRALAQTGLDPKWLELELTESALMDNAEAARTTLAALTSAGVNVSIDDFGTGYSSLAYLRDFSFSTLKIDRAFLNDIGNERKAGSVVMGLIALAHSLQLTVTAEGVETDCQLAFLRRQQCDHVQGYLVSRPVTAEQLTQLLRSEYGLPVGLDPNPRLGAADHSAARAPQGAQAIGSMPGCPARDSLVARLSGISSNLSTPVSTGP
jgi:EAL domain-containing protein (putative c-di-GMP-specific phosphodiesterase class I)